MDYIGMSIFKWLYYDAIHLEGVLIIYLAWGDIL